MDYRELGLFSILISWAAFAFLLTRWRNKNSFSISLHAASARNAYFFFTVMQLLSGSLLVVFMFQWFIPHFQLDSIYQCIFIFTMLCFYTTILIPDTKGLARRIHRITAYIMADMLCVNVIYILTACSLSLVTQVFGGMVLAYMAYCIIAFFLYRKALKSFFMRNFLRIQVLYLVAFQIFILVATYGG